jgi:hypothetical protein
MPFTGRGLAHHAPTSAATPRPGAAQHGGSGWLGPGTAPGAKLGEFAPRPPVMAAEGGSGARGPGGSSRIRWGGAETVRSGAAGQLPAILMDRSSRTARCMGPGPQQGRDSEVGWGPPPAGRSQCHTDDDPRHQARGPIPQSGKTQPGHSAGRPGQRVWAGWTTPGRPPTRAQGPAPPGGAAQGRDGGNTATMAARSRPWRALGRTTRVRQRRGRRWDGAVGGPRWPLVRVGRGGPEAGVVGLWLAQGWSAGRGHGRWPGAGPRGGWSQAECWWHAGAGRVTSTRGSQVPKSQRAGRRQASGSSGALPTPASPPRPPGRPLESVPGRRRTSSCGQDPDLALGQLAALQWPGGTARPGGGVQRCVVGRCGCPSAWRARPKTRVPGPLRTRWPASGRRQAP